MTTVRNIQWSNEVNDIHRTNKKTKENSIVLCRI